MPQLKPYQEFATPRHILQDSQLEDTGNPLTEKPVTLPEVTITSQYPNDRSDFLLVIPEVLSVLSDSIVAFQSEEQIKQISTIQVAYPESHGADALEESDFDEDTQLYKAKDNYIFSHDSKDIPVYRLDTPAYKVDFITVPVFHSKIIYNLLANKLFNIFEMDRLITVGTSELNGNGTVNKLLSRNYYTVDELSSPQKRLLDGIPNMKPPNVITGASGAFTSRSTFFNTPHFTLAVDAEGAFNLDLEKLNLDAVVDAAIVLNDLLGFDSTSKFQSIVEAKIELKRAEAGGLYM
ncbi:DEKNAAC105073 [Brettanomyces naardenensis]|uniref:DEKNAAC105073 n=1 Tax=Brettanomyces naardenensis TaxID=13370 RepID=A0A448YRY0_BRENA|nr:DEKNAAC105073 [Brettanomyces naardenensis]